VTRQNCSFSNILRILHITETDKTRQFCLVCIGGVNKPLDGGVVALLSLKAVAMFMYLKL